jgi:hypothetical protein
MTLLRHTFLRRALAILAISCFAAVGHADPAITYDPANTSTNGTLNITAVATSVLLGGPGSNSPSDAQFTLVSPFSPSSGGTYDWGNESSGVADDNGGNIHSEGDSVFGISGDATNNYRFLVYNLSEAAALAPNSPNGYGGNAPASVFAQIYSVISGLITGQQYTLRCNENLDYSVLPGESDHDIATAQSNVQAFVGDNSNQVELFNKLWSTDNADVGEVQENNTVDLINFTATAATMNLMVQFNQSTNAPYNGPSDLDDDLEARFTTNLTFSVVPEPASLCLMAIGTGMLLLGCGRKLRRSRRSD